MDEHISKAAETIARVLTAICTNGFTTDWIESRRCETRETFRFDNSERTQIIAGGEALVMITEVRRGGKISQSLPETSDWSFGNIIEWAQGMSAAECSRLSQSNNNLQPVAHFRKLVERMDTDEPELKIGPNRYRVYWDEDSDLLAIQCSDRDDKWGADYVLSLGR